MADAGWGGCGAAGASCAPLLRRRLRLRRALLRARLRVQRADGRLGRGTRSSRTPGRRCRDAGRGFPFDAAHAIGNFVIALAAGPELRGARALRAALRTEVVWA